MSRQSGGTARNRSGREAVAVLVVATALGVGGCGGPGVGAVDSQRILNESVLALSSQKQLDDREKAMAAELRLLSGSLSREDLEARREAYRRDLESLKRDLEGQLNTQIRKAVAEVARQRRLRVVLVKQAMKVGGIDITQDVIDRLK